MRKNYRQSKLDDKEKHRELRDREMAQCSQKEIAGDYVLAKRCCSSTARSAEARISIYIQSILVAIEPGEE